VILLSLFYHASAESKIRTFFIQSVHPSANLSAGNDDKFIMTLIELKSSRTERRKSLLARFPNQNGSGQRPKLRRL
jgi:hypothetical protein